jgi:hypothetical protein
VLKKSSIVLGQDSLELRILVLGLPPILAMIVNHVILITSFAVYIQPELLSMNDSAQGKRLVQN